MLDVGTVRFKQQLKLWELENVQFKTSSVHVLAVVSRAATVRKKKLSN